VRIPRPAAAAHTRVDLLLLHPAGTEDSSGIALSIGMLELVRAWLEHCSISTAFWPETMVTSEGKTLFILRPQPWTEKEIIRKRLLVPSAETAIALTLSGGPTPRVAFGMLRGSAPIRSISDFALDENGVFETLPTALDEILQAVDRPPLGKSGTAIFHTEDRTTALSLLLALERVIAFQAGVGRDTPGRLFEPALQCLAREPAHPIARECLMRIAAGMTDIGTPEAKTAAGEAIERWSALAPLSPYPPFMLAMTRMRAGDPEAARVALEEALRRDPLHAPALEHYSIWFAERGFVDKGVEVLRHAIGKTDFDTNLLDQAGCLLANVGRIDEAVPFFRQAIAGGGPMTAYSNLARALLSRGREEEALDVLKDGLAKGTDLPHLDLLAEIAKREGLAAANARAILRGRIAEGSEDEEVQRRITQLCYELDGPPAAMPQAHRLLAIGPSLTNRRFAYQVLLRARLSDFETRWDATVAAACEGDAALSLDFLKEVIEAEPMYGAGHFILAVALDRLGRPAEALPHAEKAAACEESDPVVLDLYARLLAQAERLPEAAQTHLTAASLAPRDPRILRNAAVSLLRAGYPEEGTRLAHTSLGLQPEQPDLLELLKDIRPKRKSIGSAVTERTKKLLRRRGGG
jgi:Tfp pilus assembly protein PilF